MQLQLRSLVMGLFGFLLLLAPGTVSADDGVVEINQARALAGGVTPADLPGFPVTLDASAARSYRLTGSLFLDASVTGVDAVEGATGTTLDLNGFEIACAAACAARCSSRTAIASINTSGFSIR